MSPAAREMPAQHPGKSQQDYETPIDFLEAVVKRFGSLHCDLACFGVADAKAPSLLTPAEDSLAQEWRGRGNMWLNPPFGSIAPWAAKCSLTRFKKGDRIFLLTPASVGSNWFAEHVHRKAFVLALSPRLTFVGAKDPYPKDCILSVFSLQDREAPGFDCWRWKR